MARKSLASGFFLRWVRGSGAGHYLNRLAITFTALAEPRGKRFGETLRCDAKTHFDSACARSQRVVKFGGIREVAHAEGVEPFERARPSLAANDDVHFQLPRVHTSSITSRLGRCVHAGLCEFHRGAKKKSHSFRDASQGKEWELKTSRFERRIRNRTP